MKCNIRIRTAQCTPLGRDSEHPTLFYNTRAIKIGGSAHLEHRSDKRPTCRTKFADHKIRLIAAFKILTTEVDVHRLTHLAGLVCLVCSKQLKSGQNFCLGVIGL